MANMIENGIIESFSTHVPPERIGHEVSFFYANSTFDVLSVSIPINYYYEKIIIKGSTKYL